jgi:hypothetical protein
VIITVEGYPEDSFFLRTVTLKILIGMVSELLKLSLGVMTFHM